MKTLKKIVALVIVATMVMGLCAINVSAADLDGFKVVFKNASGNVINSAKAGKTITAEIILPNADYTSAAVTLVPNKDAGIVFADANMHGNPALTYNNFNVIAQTGAAQAKKVGDFTISDAPYFSIDITIPEGTAAGALSLFTIKTGSNAVTGGTTYTIPTDARGIEVAESWIAASATLDSEQLEYEAGTTTKDEIISVLKTKTATVHRGDYGKSESGFATKDWDCATFNPDETGVYTFKGKVVPDEDKAATWTGDMEVDAIVKINPITTGNLQEFEAVEFVEADESDVIDVDKVLAKAEIEKVTVSNAAGTLSDTYSSFGKVMDPTTFDRKGEIGEKAEVTITVSGESDNSLFNLANPVEKKFKVNLAPNEWVATHAYMDELVYDPSTKTVDEVLADLGTKTATVANEDDSRSQSGFRTEGWVAPENFNPNMPGNYEFTGKVAPLVGSPVSWEGDLEVKAAVKINPFSDGDCAYGNVGFPQKQSEDAITVDEAFEKAGIKDKKAVVSTFVGEETITDTYPISGATIEPEIKKNAAIGEKATVSFTISGLSDNGMFNFAEPKTITFEVEITPPTIDDGTVGWEVDGTLRTNNMFKIIVYRDETKAADVATIKLKVTDLTKDETKAETREVTLGDLDAGRKSNLFISPKSLEEIFKDASFDVESGDTIECVLYYGDADVSYGQIPQNAGQPSEKDIKVASNSGGGGSGGGGGNRRPSNPDVTTGDDTGDDTGDVTGDDTGDVTGGDTTKKFPDVQPGYWAEQYIQKLKDYGIITGDENGNFNPEANVNRAEFVAMIARALELEATDTNLEFNDCKATDWYTPYVAAVLEAGYVTGESKEYFGANQNITREDICTILGRIVGDAVAPADITFTDVDKIADYAIENIRKMVGLGVVNGYEDGSFGPKNYATRAETATMLARLFERAEIEILAGIFGVEAEDIIEAGEEIEAAIAEETIEEVLDEEAIDEEVLDEEVIDEEVKTK